MKVGIVGAGAVGSACALALVMPRRGPRGSCWSIGRANVPGPSQPTFATYSAVAIGRHPRTAISMILQARRSSWSPPASMKRREVPSTAAMPRAGLKLLDINRGIYESLVPRLVEAASDAVILVVTDPPDPLADVARSLAHNDRVLSTGNILDSLRFRVHLAERLGVSPASVDAMVLGEHGTSQVYLWSSARIGGCPSARSTGGTRSAHRGLPAFDRARCALRQYCDYRGQRRQPIRHRHGIGADRRNRSSRRAGGHPDRMLQSGLRSDTVVACDRRTPGCRTGPRTRNVRRLNVRHAAQRRYAEIRLGACRGRNDGAPGLRQANAACAERGVRRGRKRRRLLTVYAALADFFIANDSPGGRALPKYISSHMARSIENLHAYVLRKFLDRDFAGEAVVGAIEADDLGDQALDERCSLGEDGLQNVFCRSKVTT